MVCIVLCAHARLTVPPLPPHPFRWVLPSWEHERDACLPHSLASADDHPLLIFISSPSAKDPSWAARYPGRQTLVALAPTRYEYWAECAEAGGGRMHHRGGAYSAFKARLQERMLAAVKEQVPGLAGRVKHVSLGSPLSSNFFLGTAWGEAYGLDHTAGRFDASFLRPRTPIAGLYLTGQDVMTDGVAGGALAAVMTASSIDLRVPVQNAGMLLAVAAAA